MRLLIVLFCAALQAQTWNDPNMPASVQQQLASVQKQKDALRKAGWPVMSEAPPLAPAPADVAAVTPPTPPESECHQLAPEQTKALANSAAQREGLDPKLILAVMKQESGFNPCAVSRKGALGLMQLMPATADDLFVSNPFDPEQNVFGGAHLLRQLLDHYMNDTRLALSAYNAGPARVIDAVPDIPETKAYVEAITAATERTTDPPR
ncbi:MAG TPA: lytic transglycosylase domain-containing protein [Bryobacteraceae bacterium]|nr:lytic transglycosylase domain-containing protein [Bryobacteraceae bacterium]